MTRLAGALQHCETTLYIEQQMAGARVEIDKGHGEVGIAALSPFSDGLGRDISTDDKYGMLKPS